MGLLMEHAKRELDLIPNIDAVSKKKRTKKDILEIVELLEDQDHTGFSMLYVISTLFDIMQFEPLSPLTGEDSEWKEVELGVLQNMRCSRVVKKNGKAYDLGDASSEEPTEITFPYVPWSPGKEVKE